MSEKEKRIYESQMKINPALRLVAKTPISPSELRGYKRADESYQAIKLDPAQAERINLLNRLIKHLKAL